MTITLERKAPKRNTAAWRSHVRQLELQALELHLAGVTYERIADQLGWAGRDAAYKAVHRLLDRQEADKAEELRASEGARLDRLLVAIYPKAIAGDLRAHAEVIRNRESYRRLFGLDAPLKIQPVRSEVDEEIMRLTAQLGGTVPPPLEPADDATAGSS